MYIGKICIKIIDVTSSKEVYVCVFSDRMFDVSHICAYLVVMIILVTNNILCSSSVISDK